MSSPSPAAELKDARSGLQQGCAPEWRVNYNGPLLWTTSAQQQVPPGGTAKLLYNSAAGPLASMQWAPGQEPILSYGFNDWSVPGKQVPMSKAKAPVSTQTHHMTCMSMRCSQLWSWMSLGQRAYVSKSWLEVE